MKAALEDKSTITTDWEVKLYIGIALKWDHEKVRVQLSMTGYVRAALHSFQDKNPKYPMPRHTPGHNTSMEKQLDAIRKGTK